MCDEQIVTVLKSQKLYLPIFILSILKILYGTHKHPQNYS